MFIIELFCNELEDHEEKFNNYKTFLGKAYNIKENKLYIFYADEIEQLPEFDLMTIPDYTGISKIAEFGKKHKHIHFGGPGGTGKTFRIIRLIQYFTYNRIKFYATASTGTAVSNLRTDKTDYSRYMTIHRWAGLTCIALDSYLNTDYLIIDEISMIGSNNWERIKLRAKDIVIITSGDFAQLQPIKDSKIDTSNKLLWNPLLFTFNTPYRFVKNYYEYLITNIMNIYTKKQINAVISEIRTITIEEALNEKFTILSCTRETANSINAIEIVKLPVGIISKCTELAPTGSAHKTFISEITFPEILDLRIGAPVILKKNINIEEGLTNGTQGVVVNVNPVIVRFGVIERIIEMETQNVYINKNNYWRTQFPLQLGWALTVHQSQGMTLNSVAFIIKGLFEPSQLYVAMSRVRSIDKFAII